jgi:hypothetical protein
VNAWVLLLSISRYPIPRAVHLKAQQFIKAALSYTKFISSSDLPEQQGIHFLWCDDVDTCQAAWAQLAYSTMISIRGKAPIPRRMRAVVQDTNELGLETVSRLTVPTTWFGGAEHMSNAGENLDSGGSFSLWKPVVAC